MSKNWKYISIKVVAIFGLTTSISLIAAHHDANRQFPPPGGQPPTGGQYNHGGQPPPGGQPPTGGQYNHGGQPPTGGQPNACDMTKIPARCKPLPAACMAKWINGLAPRGCFPKPGCKPPPECI